MTVTNEYTVKDGIKNPQDGGGNCYECNSGDCDGGPFYVFGVETMISQMLVLALLMLSEWSTKVCFIFVFG